MELCEFAERVLFATTLEEKLQCPAVITDERPGLPITTPEAPGRPRGLTFKSRTGGRADFPGVQRLERARERGRLLHFFANHELLATELMALALLRFPNAPTAFRRGVLQTLRDEQRHTSMYLQRMEECGTRFGELPVSGFFWRAISGMADPIDYVAGLSLTFEQANLDFAGHFARGFRLVGDARTASLLDTVHHDEIGHVAYGLKWFRQWKDPRASDWEAFCRHLKFPLSPQRAKGFVLNVEARRAAGLDAQFIDELNVYSRSKGRTPAVFVFNPFAEARMAQGPAFTPGKQQAQLARDLSALPQFLCRQDDVVLVERSPAVPFLSGLKNAGFALPEFVELQDRRLPPESDLPGRKLGELRPWAWGPDSLELFEPLFAHVGGSPRRPEECFNASIARLYAKSWSADLLTRFLACRPPEAWLCPETAAGIPCDTSAAALEAVAAIRRRGHHKIVIKEDHGLAGQNAIRLWEAEVLDSQRRWLEHALEGQRRVVVEPWLERELDFSVQLEMGQVGLKVCGYTGLVNDRKGQFQANWAAANCKRRLPDAVARALRSPSDVGERVQRLFADLAAALEAELVKAGYRGPVGIDAFVYRDGEGACRLKPVVEINPRYTMGRVLVELLKRACPGSRGTLRLVTRAAAQAEGFGDFARYERALAEQRPLRLRGEPVRRIFEGAICLNDPQIAESCLAVFQVESGPGGAGAEAAP